MLALHVEGDRQQMDYNRRRAPSANGNGKSRGIKTVVRILLLDVYENRGQATGDGGCVARIKSSVNKARPELGQWRDGLPKALLEMSTATQSFISLKNGCDDIKQAV